MAVELHLTSGRWVASCSHCGAPLVGADEQADVEAVLTALGVPTIGASDEEAALAHAERALFGDT
jgi:hypothetical protein